MCACVRVWVRSLEERERVRRFNAGKQRCWLRDYFSFLRMLKTLQVLKKERVLVSLTAADDADDADDADEDSKPSAGARVRKKEREKEARSEMK